MQTEVESRFQVAAEQVGGEIQKRKQRLISLLGEAESLLETSSSGLRQVTEKQCNELLVRLKYEECSLDPEACNEIRFLQYAYRGLSLKQQGIFTHIKSSGTTLNEIWLHFMTTVTDLMKQHSDNEVLVMNIENCMNEAHEQMRQSRPLECQESTSSSKEIHETVNQHQPNACSSYNVQISQESTSSSKEIHETVNQHQTNACSSYNVQIRIHHSENPSQQQTSLTSVVNGESCLPLSENHTLLSSMCDASEDTGLSISQTNPANISSESSLVTISTTQTPLHIPKSPFPSNISIIKTKSHFVVTKDSAVAGRTSDLRVNSFQNKIKTCLVQIESSGNPSCQDTLSNSNHENDSKSTNQHSLQSPISASDCQPVLSKRNHCNDSERSSAMFSSNCGASPRGYQRRWRSPLLQHFLQKSNENTQKSEEIPNVNSLLLEKNENSLQSNFNIARTKPIPCPSCKSPANFSKEVWPKAKRLPLKDCSNF